MNLNRNQLLEIVGFTSVLLGLVFIAFELNQNSESLRAQTRTEITANTNIILERFMEDDIVEALLKVQRGEELSDAEAFKLNLLTRWQFRSAENVYYQYRVGNFDDDEFEGYRNFYKSSLTRPNATEFWQSNYLEFSIQFRKEMEELMN